MACYAVKTLVPHFIANIIRFGSRSLVSPYNRLFKRRSVVVNAKASHHLPAKTYCGNIFRIYSLDYLPGSCTNRLPPVIRVLLSPIPVKIVCVVAVYLAFNHFAVSCEECGFIPRCAKIMCQKVFAHVDSLPDFL